jgi:hypothetical protein
MLKKSFLSLSIVLVFAFSAFAQKTYTPEKGSAERTAILNALRTPVEKELKQKIQFAVNTLRVSGNWAFVNGEPQNASGGIPNYRITQYRRAVEDGFFDNNFQALLRRQNGKWRVVTYAIGCTDVCWYGWWDDYKAPKSIFPVGK